MFTKGQEVTVINLYSRGEAGSKLSQKVSFTVEHLIVHSCGKKQMILRNAAGEIFKRRLYKPSVDQYTVYHSVNPRMSDDAALLIANDLTLKYCADQVARYDNILSRATKSDAGYIRVITRDRDHYATNPIAPAFVYEGQF